MEKSITVYYDGEVFRPETPHDLEPNTRYVISIQKDESPAPPLEDAWDILERLAGTVEAPPDWSEEHDHYIHGAPKRSQRTE